MSRQTGKQYWRSLEELADTPEFRAFVESEFPNHMAEFFQGPTRRHFLKIMGASLALAGLTGCRRWPERKLAPYSHRPEGRTPGEPERFATAMEIGGVAQPVLVTSYDGRPVKIEGNPSHPASGGAATAIAQASVLQLYDPDRSRFPLRRSSGIGEQPTVVEWTDAKDQLKSHFAELRNSGKRLAVLSGMSGSPSLARMKQQLLEAFPNASWHTYEPVNRDNEIAATKKSFGQAARPVLHLDKADRIVCLGADILGSHPDALRHARDWAKRRRMLEPDKMNRMYVFESSYSITGGVADHRVPTTFTGIARTASELHRSLKGEASTAEKVSEFDTQQLVDDLKQHKGRCVVVAGVDQPVAVHQLCYQINEALGNFGKTITMVAEPEEDATTRVESLRSLVDAMNGGEINTLLILGGNPVYDAPADFEFTSAMDQVEHRVHLSLYDDETSQRCTLHVPQAHYLEAWSDARSWDGTKNIVQPLIRPLYDGLSNIELIALAMDDSVTDGYDIVRETFKAFLSADSFEPRWRQVLHDGILPDSGYARVSGTPNGADETASLDTTTESLALEFKPHPAVYDGRFANNGWLQELPDPLTTLTWDNAALISGKDAATLEIKTSDLVKLTVNQKSLDIPAYVMPGQTPGVVTVHLGYGRPASGGVGTNLGANVYPLRTSDTMHAANGIGIAKTGKKYELALTQDHHAIDELGFQERKIRVGKLIRENTLGGYLDNPDFAKEMVHAPTTLQLWKPPVLFDGHAWGMSVDLTSCIGCGACTVACQAENNIPVVGKDEVITGREMHWIRVDRYFKGEPDEPSPQVAYQPVMCQHCENAPCEQVCPVAATVHDTEGLNAMVYNRCIGTRYCSNNCPYKVRRFNYFDYHSVPPRQDPVPWFGMPDTQQRESVNSIKQMVNNPEVTVRMRGVMEKCTYCVQRIYAVKIPAKNEGRTIKDGEIVPACAQTCPTEAIIFGDLNDPNSRVRKLQEQDRAYGILTELNTRPRTMYMAKITNPSTQEKDGSSSHHASASNESEGAA